MSKRRTTASVVAAVALVVGLGTAGASAFGRHAASETKACKNSRGYLVLPRASGTCPSGSSRVSLGAGGLRGVPGPKGATGSVATPGTSTGWYIAKRRHVVSTTFPSVFKLATVGGITVKGACWLNTSTSPHRMNVVTQAIGTGTFHLSEWIEGKLGTNAPSGGPAEGNASVANFELATANVGLPYVLYVSPALITLNGKTYNFDIHMSINADRTCTFQGTGVKH